THAAPPAAPDALASLAPRADIACGELRHFIGLRMRRIDESECGGARRLESRPQAPDFFPPCHGEEVAVGVPSFLPHAALAKRKLVLRIHERRGGAWPRGVDATRTQGVVGDDLLVLVRAHRAPDFAGHLLADDLPLPRAASPQRERGDQEEW